MEDHFFEYAQEKPAVSGKHTSVPIRYFDLFSSIATESFHVLDILQKQFYYVKPDDLFLCGYSAEEALKQGYDFYSKIIYPKDLSLWTDMRKAVLRYFEDFEEKRNEIDYFSCTLRLQRKYSFLTRPLPQMIYHRMKPVWEDNELRSLICSVESSIDREAGNLCMYNKDGLTYEEYGFKTGRWKRKTKKLLTERERAILMLAGQGKSSKEIANDLCKGKNTIQNQIKALFAKLNVHSMQEAIEFAGHHRMIYSKQNMELQPVEAPRKRKRVLITEDMLRRTQQHLDDGKSIRQAARLEGITEGAVRYEMKAGWLKKR
jgi:DNA-binding CsgD family transcriptional regulator